MGCDGAVGERVAAPAGAVVYCNVRPVAFATGYFLLSLRLHWCGDRRVAADMESNFREAFGFVRGRARDRAGKIFEVSGR